MMMSQSFHGLLKIIVLVITNASKERVGHSRAHISLISVAWCVLLNAKKFKVVEKGVDLMTQAISQRHFKHE